MNENDIGLKCELLYKFKSFEEFANIKQKVYEYATADGSNLLERLCELGIKEDRANLLKFKLIGQVGYDFLFLHDCNRDIIWLNEAGYYRIILSVASKIICNGQAGVWFEQMLYKRGAFEDQVVKHSTVMRCIYRAGNADIAVC